MTDSPKRASTSSRMNPIWLNASTLMNMSWWFCIADLFHATIPRSKLIYNIYKHGICAFMLQFQLIHWCSSRIWTKSWNIQTLKLNLQKDKVNRKLNHSASSPRPSWNLTSSPRTLWYLRVTWATCCSFKASKKGHESAMNDLGFHCWGFVQKVK